MTDERDELVRERARLEAALSELGATIDDVEAEIDAIESDLAAILWERDVATKRFLPDDRLPTSVTNETREAISSHLDTLGEQRDVRSEEEAMKREALGVATKNAADAREDIGESAAAIDRLDDRTDESESELADAREELAAAQGRFEDDSSVLAERLETFDIGLTPETLGAVIDDRIPEQQRELEALIEGARERIAEFSTRTTRLAAERDRLASIDGGGTCPTCSQAVGAERTETEAEANEAERHQLDRQLGAAERKRDELLARRGELSDLRDQLLALGSFRSDVVAGVAGRLEDREEDVEDLQADLDEERAELTEAEADRDRADAAMAALETELAALDAEIDKLEGEASEGNSLLEVFTVVDGFRGHLEELRDELADLREADGETDLERASIEWELEELTDDE